ncbi:MAG: hypothetical protein O7J95_15345, partial [Planctomycetota bacterium]|nr:hypothetical protein [Planctomycetota bacterium]
FRRGNVNADAEINLSDGIFLLAFLFRGGDPPGCRKAADTNDDGLLDLSDAVYLFSFLFLGGPPPGPPHGDCGQDEGPNLLGCSAFPPCG